MPHASNRLLSALVPDDYALLSPHLSPVALEQGSILSETGDRVSHVYFPWDAVISLVVTLSTGESVEAAMVGRDGVVGAMSALDGKHALNRTIVQIGGSGAMCEAATLKACVMQSPSLLSAIVSHELTMFAQAQQSAACNITHHVEARLCRWLLRARDLSGGNTLAFTQEFLADMLGVRRTAVSPAALTLQRAGLIQYSRGKIQLLDVGGLKDSACECYATVNQHYETLLGHNREPAA